MRITARVLALVIAVSTAVPAFAQNGRGPQWVATWATALVARAQGPGGFGGRGQGPVATPPAPAAQPTPPSAVAAPSGPPAAAPAAPPGGGRGGFPAPVTITNQTIRQVVRVSIGGDRLRVVLSNAFGTAPLEIGAAHVALRDHDALVKASSVKPLTFGGSTTGKDFAGCDDRERCGRSHGAGRQRSCRGPISSRRAWHRTVASDDAQRCLSDELPVGYRQSFG